MATDPLLGGGKKEQTKGSHLAIKNKSPYIGVSQSVVPGTPHPSPGMWVKVQMLGL